MKKLTIDDARRVAEERGGECLSENYIGYETKMLWKCVVGHKWLSTIHNIKGKGGRWCPHCSGRAKLTLNDAITIASERNGMCLSEEYKNTDTYMKWQCKKGHI